VIEIKRIALETTENHQTGAEMIIEKRKFKLEPTKKTQHLTTYKLP